MGQRCDHAGNLDPGEHRVVIIFAELPLLTSPTPALPSGPSKGLGSLKINLLTRLGITLYGMKGTPKAEATLEEAKVTTTASQVVVEGKAQNKGNIRIPLTLKAQIVDSGKKEMGKGETRIIVQRSQWRNFKIVLPKPPVGRYRVLLSGVGRDSVLFQTSLPLDTWNPNK